MLAYSIHHPSRFQDAGQAFDVWRCDCVSFEVAFGFCSSKPGRNNGEQRCLKEASREYHVKWPDNQHVSLNPLPNARIVLYN
jgi:hypothetical protein